VCEAFLTLYLIPTLGVIDVDIWTSWLLARFLPDLIALAHWQV